MLLLKGGSGGDLTRTLSTCSREYALLRPEKKGCRLTQRHLSCHGHLRKVAGEGVVDAGHHLAQLGQPLGLRECRARTLFTCKGPTHHKFCS
jgi:hypothetical protein